ncbi:predicted protein [Nematostella vectensis]|uniref:Adenosine 3'-phospho 5'-phosphosulfate transporter 1 n=1 Tax=Nematostella vectensis TaxID=45351 RepID=A7RNX8_NEMVE|nr:predicted protein [Nematostella vectensis]|eukprot:XP_001638881.1 predicted protein [Nematostella vectensis]
MWNVVGYATIVIPAAVVIRMIKNSNFNEKEDPQSEMEKGTTGHERSDATPVSLRRTASKLLICVAGLQMSYIMWGILQERVMTQSYQEILPDGTTKEVKFKNSQFLVFVNRILAMGVAGVYIIVTRQPQHRAPLYKYSYSSFSNIMSSWCQYEALKFVSFPTQVLCKASKIIPVMLMGKLVSKKSYPYYEYFIAVVLSVGVSLFLLSTGTQKKTAVETTVSGALILLGYMLFDSFTSNWQSELFHSYKMSSMQMMFGTNLFSSIFTFWSLLQNGKLFSSVIFAIDHPEFAYHSVILSLCSATGQLFIFYTIQSFGPVVFTIIMTTRLMLSIVISCILYQHPLSTQAVFGVIVVFTALFLRVYARYRTKGTGKG